MGEDYNGDRVATLSIGQGLCPSGGIIGQLSVCGPYRRIICGPYKGIIGQLSVPSAFDAAMQQRPGIDDNILLILPANFSRFHIC